jgi:glycosyltransferase involved in cell wall biosynthesis
VKICFLIDSLAPGGAERSTVNLAIWLKSYGHSIVIACLHDREPGFASEVEARHIPIQYLQGNLLNRLFTLKSLLKTEKIDVLHSTLAASNFLARIVTWLSIGHKWSYSYSIVSNSYGPHRHLDKRVKPWKLHLVQYFDSLSIKLAKPLTHSVTQSAAFNAAKHLGFDLNNVTVVYRGRPEFKKYIDLNHYRRQLDIPENSFVFIHVGRQEYAKNHDGLISAFEQVYARNKSARLLLVGKEGNVSNEVKTRIAASTASAAIVQLGHRSDVPELLRCANAFVLPSHFEGLSGAMIEAMEAGLPVICSDLDGLKEGCEPDRSALLCDPGSPDSIANAMLRVLNEPDLARSLGQRGREIFQQRFTLDASCKGMQDFFETVLAKGRAVRRQALGS